MTRIPIPGKGLNLLLHVFIHYNFDVSYSYSFVFHKMRGLMPFKVSQSYYHYDFFKHLGFGGSRSQQLNLPSSFGSTQLTQQFGFSQTWSATQLTQ